MQIDSAVLDVLGNANTNGLSLALTGQLDRKLYVAVNKILELAGGKWNKSAKAHIFPFDAAETMDQIILSGEIRNAKQELGYFPSPAAVVERLLELAEVRSGMRILEPSAGRGAIIRGVLDEGDGRTVLGYEIDPSNVKYCEDHAFDIGNGFSVIQCDFLALSPAPVFDRVIMNPPFGKNASLKHVLHALRFLKPDGRLISVMPSSVTFRTDALNTSVRDKAKSIEPLPNKSFAGSGTNIDTVVVTINP